MARFRVLALAGAAMLTAGSAGAQATNVLTTVDTRLTYTDNVRAGRDERSDVIAEVSPGIAVLREGGRIQGGLNARLRTLAHAQERRRDTTYLALFGHGQVEALENRLFIDMNASVSRRNRSAFFGRGPGDFLDAESANETRLFSVGPRLHFNLWGEAQGVASYTRRWFDAGRRLGRRDVDEWRAEASDPAGLGRLGWGLSYVRTDTEFPDRPGSDVSQEVGRATLFFNVTPQFRLRGIAGQERNDFLQRSQSGSIAGAGFDWRPTPRTSISATMEDRLFGTGYHLGFSHRFARSAWDLSVSRDFSSSLQTLGSVFSDPLFRGLYDGLASAIPDPLERELFVRDLLGYGIPGLRDSFVTNAQFLNRTARAGVSLLGVRNVVTFSVARSSRERLTEAAALAPEDDFAIFERVDTNSASVSLHHRLAPLTSLDAQITRSRSKGFGTARGDTERTRLSVRLSRTLGPSVSGGLLYSYQRAEGTTEFTENVVSANLAMRF